MTIAVFPQLIGSMNDAILFCGTLVFAFAFRIIGRVLDKKQLKINGKEISMQDAFYKALSVLLFLVYMPQLFMRDTISLQVGLRSAVRNGDGFACDLEVDDQLYGCESRDASLL